VNYTERDYRGRTQYDCRRCPFTTSRRDGIERHARERHPGPAFEPAAEPDGETKRKTRKEG